MADTGDLHEAVFRWPDASATEVIVTGTFDQWSSSIHLTKSQSGYEASTKVPWGEKVEYKFIVDGRWRTNDSEPTVTNSLWNVNNVYTAPSKPAPPVNEPPTALPPYAENHLPEEAAKDDNTSSDATSSSVTEQVIGKASEFVEQIYPDVVTPSKTTDNAFDPETVPATVETTKHVVSRSSNGHIENLLSATADTVAARDGTNSVVGYLASGLGAAIQSVVGVDPINVDKIAVPTPESNPGSEQANPPPSDTVPELALQEVAPGLPVPIIPVNVSSDPIVDGFPTSSELSVQVPPPECELTPAEESAPSNLAASEQPSTHTPAHISDKAALAPSEAPATIPGATPGKPTNGVSDISTPSTTEPVTDGTHTHLKTNGGVPPTTEFEGKVDLNVKDLPATPAPVPIEPITPSKKPFPTSQGSDSAPSSPKSSKFSNISSTRKKRTSIFGKIKQVFEGKEKSKLK